MIVQEISGGLGNQMFQYAFARAVCLRQGIEVALCWSDEEAESQRQFALQSAFDIKARLLTQPEMRAFLGWQHSKLIRKGARKVGCQRLMSRWIHEPHFHFSPQMRQVPDQVFMRGYWQSEKYFSTYQDSIRSEFRFKTPVSERSRVLAEQIRKGERTAVSLHVRRGDYISSETIRRKHCSCSSHYYASAVEYVAARVSNPYFFIFSDDLEWVRSNLHLDLPHVLAEHDCEASHEDMLLMSLCRHNIIANSTFSWWGAWLNSFAEKIVVAPKNWFADGTSAIDLLPQGWVTL